MSYINNSDNVSNKISLIAGSLSGLTVRSIIAPIDIIKIRLQLQLNPSQYKSLTQTIISIYKNEGLLAFWKGNLPASLMYLVYGGTQFYIFTSLSNLSTNSKKTPLFNTLIGTISGCMATLISYPFDLLRTRLASNNSKSFTSVTKTISQIWSNSNWIGLYLGSPLSICYIALTTGISFGVYTKINEFDNKVPFQIKNIAGLTAGLISKTLVYPLDLIKRRIQMNYNQSFIQTLNQIVKNNGIFALYRGLLPALLKSAPTTALSFFFYENYTYYLIRIFN